MTDELNAELVNESAEVVSDLPARDAVSVDEVAELINAGADFHKSIKSVDGGSVVIKRDNGNLTGYIQLENTTSYAATEATKLLRALGADVDRSPGATRDGRVWFTLEVSNENNNSGNVTCPNCRGTDLKDGAAVENGRTFDFGCRECRTVFNRGDVK